MPILPIDDSGQRIQALRPDRAKTVVFTAASAASTPFAATTTVVRLAATSHCCIVFGHNPTASAAGHYLPAGAPEYFRVVPGEAVAAIRVAADGVLHISEMT